MILGPCRATVCVGTGRSPCHENDYRDPDGNLLRPRVAFGTRTDRRLRGAMGLGPVNNACIVTREIVAVRFIVDS